MTTQHSEPIDGSHASHDRLLIAAHAAGDLATAELARADALLGTCESCRDLHADLLALATATHDLPPRARPTDRDFRIPADRAATLVRGSVWRRLLRPFARKGTASRPLALAFTTLGVAGLFLSALPSLQLGGGGGDNFMAATAPEATDSRNQVYATADPDSLPPQDMSGGGTEVEGGGQPAASGEKAGAGGGAGVPGPSTAPTEGLTANPTPTDASNPTAPSPLILLSVAFLAAGLGLVALRMAAVRLR